MNTVIDTGSSTFSYAAYAAPGAALPAAARSTPPELLALHRRNVERVKAAYLKGQVRFPSDPKKYGTPAAVKRDWQKMTSNPLVSAGIRRLVNSIAALDLQVLPQDPTSEREREVAEFVRHLFRRVRGGLYPRGKAGLIREVARPAVLRGKVIAEKKWATELEGRWAGKQVWEAWKSKREEDVELQLDDYANITGVEGSTEDGRELLPASRFCIYLYEPLYCDPEGQAALLAAHRDWVALTFGEQLWGLGLEKWGSPFLKGVYAEEAHKAALEEALEEAGANRWISLPMGTVVETVAAASSDGAGWQQFIDTKSKNILIAINGSHLPILEGTTPNVAGDSRVQRGSAELTEWSLSDDMAAVLTEEAEEAVELNFRGVPPPAVVLGAVSEQEIAAMLTNDKLMVDIGVPPSAQSIYQRSGREPPRDDGDRPQAAAAPAVPGLFADQEGEQGRPFVPSWRRQPL